MVDRKYLDVLKEFIFKHHKIENTTMDSLENMVTLHNVEKNNYIYRFDDTPTSFFFILEGLFRAYVINEQGKEHNKNFFYGERFFGSIIESEKKEPINYAVQALEDSLLIEIPFQKYRQLLMKHQDLMLFHICYIEKHWTEAKRLVEDARMYDDAKTRYLKFKKMYPGIASRVSQYHIASYLGITPTHLSRICKSQPM